MTLVLFKLWLSTLLPFFILGHMSPFGKDKHILDVLFMFVTGAMILSGIAMITSLIWLIQI